ncbi:hypothetical protein SAMN04490202_5687 [Pseudomonas reinekei]|jgi:hypothetical protein|uniref:Uncharacterized protein n=2 Tax=Pseudomonas reinekei TaxID=395598 RepID=A0A1H0UWV1_PSERE|nr:hypothetical protein [Pseudomonas reinekei]KAB0488516.1 hypothetical protein F7R15_01230 [Pseudomonas reinekei]SDP70408.1 hypothetical protein SAMN04490202_5687 [Pseudomonas reinekei]
MHYLKMLTSAVALGCSLMLTSSSIFADTAKQENLTNGFIVFGDVEGSVIDFPVCRIPAIEGKYYFGDPVGCRDNDYNAMIFINVPSALTVTVFDDGGCERDNDVPNNWEFAITTVKNPTTSGDGDVSIPGNWITFYKIWLTPDNTVVEPGVMKSGRWKRPPPSTMPNLHNEASCVLVQRK